MLATHSSSANVGGLGKCTTRPAAAVLHPVDTRWQRTVRSSRHARYGADYKKHARADLVCKWAKSDVSEATQTECVNAVRFLAIDGESMVVWWR